MIRKLYFVFICVIVSHLAVYAQDRSAVRVILSTFNTPSPHGEQQKLLGRRAATILGVQIFLTLRAGDPRRPSAELGTGVVHWDLYSPPPTNRLEAANLTWEFSERGDKSQMALWGNAFPYAGGIIVAANLTLSEDQTKKAATKGLWSIHLQKGNKRYSVSLGLPSGHYEFQPLVLRSDLPPEIDNPAVLKIYKDPEGKQFDGTLGGSFALRGRVGDFVKVGIVKKGREVQRYVYAPTLSKERNEIVDFCSGLIRILREDWSGVVEKFQPVVENKNTPTAIKIDSYLYMAVASEYLGNEQNSLLYLREAHKLNPYKKTITQHLCMYYLKQLAGLNVKKRDVAQRLSVIKIVRELLAKNSALFSVDDEWIMQVKQFLSAAEE